MFTNIFLNKFSTILRPSEIIINQNIDEGCGAF